MERKYWPVGRCPLGLVAVMVAQVDLLFGHADGVLARDSNNLLNFLISAASQAHPFSLERSVRFFIFSSRSPNALSGLLSTRLSG
jgi:hypothetical protein